MASEFVARLRAELGSSIFNGAGDREPLLLQNASLPRAGVCQEHRESLGQADEEGNVLADVLIVGPCIASFGAPGSLEGGASAGAKTIDLAGRMVWPCFCDAHAHLFKCHACPRHPNPTGSVDGAMAEEALDRPWSSADIVRRMDFALRSAYVHGVRVVRTHLDGTEDHRAEQRSASWEAFDAARAEWAGRVALQGVANLFLPLWSDDSLARMQISEATKRSPAVALGAYCGAIRTEDGDGALSHFQELFRLAQEFGNLPVDLHIDENNDPNSCGSLLALRALVQARRSLGYTAPVVLGHACAVSLMPAERVEEILSLARDASPLTVVANPLTNAWLQDRRGTTAATGVAIPEAVPRTPQWRGMTLVQEFAAAGVSVALGGDNVRDWWFNYGDSDPLEVFRMGVLLGHLDKPHGSLGAWATSTTCVPAAALGGAFLQSAIGAGSLALGPGASADIIIFNARSFSELLARPQSDRVVLRSHGEVPGGAVELRLVHSTLPQYEELDDLVPRKT